MDETAVWKEAAKYLWTVVAGVGAWLYNKQDSRIKTLEDSMYSKTSERERREEVDKLLEARRQDVIHLHDKIDARSEKLNEKIDLLARDMNTGLHEIKTILLERK